MLDEQLPVGRPLGVEVGAVGLADPPAGRLRLVCTLVRLLGGPYSSPDAQGQPSVEGHAPSLVVGVVGFPGGDSRRRLSVRVRGQYAGETETLCDCLF